MLASLYPIVVAGISARVRAGEHYFTMPTPVYRGAYECRINEAGFSETSVCEA